MNTPAIQEGGCTKLPRPPRRDGPDHLGDIPISGSALVSFIGLFAGVLAGVLQAADHSGTSGRIVAVVALAMSAAGLIKSKTRFERALAVIALLTTIAACTAIAIWHRSRAPTPVVTTRLIEDVASKAFKAAQWFIELERSSDVVVERTPSGILLVRGRAVRTPVVFASTQELRAFLSTLPSPGTGLVLVSWPGGQQGLLASTPPDVAAARADLSALLASAGFPPQTALPEERSVATAKELLDRSIAYHDPNGIWERGAFQITESASRPDGADHRNVLRFYNAQSRFELDSSVDGRALVLVVKNDMVVARLEGKANLSADEIERYRLKPAQVLSRRNRDLYLWGLPMKLRDPGTVLDPAVRETHFEGRAVYELRVTYDPGVGSDTWYFFLDRETCALVGHRFHHGTSAGDGEYAVFSDEISGQGLRLPRVRRWYTNREKKPVITHTIVSITAP